MAGGFESPLIDSEVGTETNTDKDFSWAEEPKNDPIKYEIDDGC